MKAVTLVAAVAVLSACAMMEKEPDAAAGVAASSMAFEDAFNAGDAAAVAALYAADAMVMPPNANRIEGRAAIQELWQSYIDADLDKFHLTTVTLDAQGDTATELGRFAVDAPNGKGGRVTVKGKYIVLWKQGEDGVWRLQWDIWNDDPAG